MDKWLRACGAPEDEPRRDVYLTSLIKCVCPVDSPTSREYKSMARNCAQFLARQHAIVRPRLVITLGKPAYNALRGARIAYGEALCRVQRTAETKLFSEMEDHYELLPWPHPSGLNRWTNSKVNRSLLEGSFALVRKALEDIA